ncbi:MAG: HdeD family acid-resistance protein [Bacteroidales bacterium]
MDTTPTSKKLISSWWAYLLNGLLFIVLGIWMISMPIESFNTFSILIGIIIGVSGLAEVFFSVRYRKNHEEWTWNILGGLLDLIIGILILFDPSVFLKIITLVISISLLVAAVVLIRGSVLSNRQGHRSWTWKLAFGILVFLLAMVLIFRPEVLAMTIMLWMGIAFISLGVLRVFLAFQIHSLVRK